MRLFEFHTDEQLMAALKEDNEAAFTEIYYRYWKLLFSVALNKLDNLVDAEEVVQEVYIDLWNRRKGIEISHSVKAFLTGAVKFQIYSCMDRNHRLHKQRTAGSSEKYIHLHVEEVFDVKELKEQLENAARELPERCRLVYELSRNQGFANKKIAQILNISEKTVENQMTKALRHLRASLKFFFFYFF